MKRLLCTLLSLLTLLALAACGSEPVEEDPVLGSYYCTSLTLEDLALSTDNAWILLKRGGSAEVSLNGAQSGGRWTLEGDAFALTLDDGTKGTGTLSGGILSLDLEGMVGSFAKEGGPRSETRDTTTFSCGGLYYVDYDPTVFQADPSRLADLKGDGVEGWIAKLGDPDLVAQWLEAFTARRSDGTSMNYENRELTVAGYPATAIVYQNDTGWHSEILVNFGEDKGREDQNMWAAYLCFVGDSRENVWNDSIQALIYSLRLGA